MDQNALGVSLKNAETWISVYIKKIIGFYGMSNKVKRLDICEGSICVVMPCFTDGCILKQFNVRLLY